MSEAYIDTLIDGNGNIYYPNTKEKAIFDDDGVNLSNKLSQFGALIDCTCTYSIADNIFTLEPINLNIDIPEVFTVRFFAPIDYEDRAKFKIKGVVYTPYLTAGSATVPFRSFFRSTVVTLNCYKPADRETGEAFFNTEKVYRRLEDLGLDFVTANPDSIMENMAEYSILMVSLPIYANSPNISPTNKNNCSLIVYKINNSYGAFYAIDTDGNLFTGRYNLSSSTGDKFKGWKEVFYSDGTTNMKTDIRFIAGDRVSIPMRVKDMGENTTGVLLGDGGVTIVGSGESANSLFTDLGGESGIAETEQLHLASDGPIYIHAHCQTIANRKTIVINNNGSLTVPAFTDYATPKVRNIHSGTTDLTAGTSTLANGGIYLVYE